jgi:hypothetical protein
MKAYGIFGMLVRSIKIFARKEKKEMCKNRKMYRIALK